MMKMIRMHLVFRLFNVFVWHLASPNLASKT